jgi:hypothetical protein
MTERKIVDIGPACRGNTGQWGRTVTYEVETPLGPMPIVDWENLPEPEAGADHG